MKGIAIASQHPVLEGCLTELNVLSKDCEQRMKFIEKQADDLQKSFDTRKGATFDKITSYCQEKGLLPADYSKDKYHMHIDKDTGLFMLCTGSHEENAKIQMLLGSLPIQ